MAIKVRNVGVMLAGWQVETALDPAEAAAAAAEAAVLAGYKFERHKTSGADGEDSDNGTARVAKNEDLARLRTRFAAERLHEEQQPDRPRHFSEGVAQLLLIGGRNQAHGSIMTSSG